MRCIFPHQTFTTCTFQYVLTQKNLFRFFFRILSSGMSFHSFIGGIFLIYGEAAIPDSTYGTITTCTIQGFFLYTSFTTSILYYCSFSFFSLVGVLNNFNKSKIIWIEKYIHIGVHIYPICSSIYLLTLKAFNNVGLGYCLTGSAPIECMVPNSTVPCTRGPSNTIEYLKMNLFWLIPYLFELFVPTLIMIILYFMVYKKSQRQQQQQLLQQQQQQECQDQPIRIESKDIAIQSLIYLFVIYWTIIPFIIQQILLFINDGSDPNSLFHFVLFCNINLSLFGLWTLFTYLYFSIDTRNNKNNNDNSILNFTGSEIVTTARTAAITTIESQQMEHGRRSPSSHQEEEEEEGGGTRKKRRSRQYSFNIFDGTNASGEFAAFIHDGDSDDENVDNEQTNHWDTIQDHV
jgi:hypothetical protein